MCGALENKTLVYFTYLLLFLDLTITELLPVRLLAYNKMELIHKEYLTAA